MWSLSPATGKQGTKNPGWRELMVNWTNVGFCHLTNLTHVLQYDDLTNHQDTHSTHKERKREKERKKKERKREAHSCLSKFCAIISTKLIFTPKPENPMIKTLAWTRFFLKKMKILKNLQNSCFCAKVRAHLSKYKLF